MKPYDKHRIPVGKALMKHRAGDRVKVEVSAGLLLLCADPGDPEK